MPAEKKAHARGASRRGGLQKAVAERQQAESRWLGPDERGRWIRRDGLAAVERVRSGGSVMYRALRAKKSGESSQESGADGETSAWEPIFAWCHQSLRLAMRDAGRAVEAKKEVRKGREV